jgi:ATP-binding cassette subfamily B protein
LARALDALAGTARLSPVSRGFRGPPEAVLDGGPRAVAEWIEAAAAYLGFEAQSVTVAYSDVGAMLLCAGPGLVELRDGRGLLVIVGARGRRQVRLLAPDLSVHTIPLAALEQAICEPLERAASDDVEACLQAAAVPPARRARARRALLRERLATEQLLCAHMFRQVPGMSVAKVFRSRAVAGKFALQALGHVVGLALAATAWSALGRGVFSDHLERGWLWAVIVLLFSAIPFQLLEECYAWLVALELGARLKEWLLTGVLRLEPEEIRYDGAGAHLARVIESESIQAAVLSGATFSIMSVLEIVLALLILRAGAGGTPHALLLLGWCVGIAILAAVYGLRARAWTDHRLTMTAGNVERLMGHTTRLVQEAPNEWHEAEDRELEPYVTSSRRMDDVIRRMFVFAGRGWLLGGLMALVPSFARPEVSPAMLAVSVAGVLFGQRALVEMGKSLTVLIDVAIGARAIAPLVRAARRVEPAGAPAFAFASDERGGPSGGVLLDGRDLVYRYQGRLDPVLRGCDLQIRSGDRILLEGASGSGKSTLGALLAGLRQPSSGLLLLKGLDRRTLGQAGWRRRVVAVPQFHENYVFNGTLAYNVLMGSRWPATEQDLDEADAACRDLGLGQLIDRMPSGMQTIVGDTGWQLSHGERSRIFIARALLQPADLLVLDESFAALDPETLKTCMHAVLARARTLVTIAHP